MYIWGKIDSCTTNDPRVFYAHFQKEWQTGARLVHVQSWDCLGAQLRALINKLKLAWAKIILSVHNCASKWSHNWMRTHLRPSLSLFFKVGYIATRLLFKLFSDTFHFNQFPSWIGGIKGKRKQKITYQIAADRAVLWQHLDSTWLTSVFGRLGK